MRLAYLVSRYPAVSHTFILREVQALRELGVGITTFSIRRTPPGEVLSEAEEAEYRATKALVPPSVPDLIIAHVTAVLSHPARYFASLLLALRLTRGGLRSLVWQVFYFGEAILLWRWCSKQQIPHIHAHFANVSADVALLACHFGSIPTSRNPALSWSFTAHGPTEFYDVSKHRLQEKVESATFVVCISDFCRSQLMAIVSQDHWDKLRVIHCGIDPTIFRPRNRRPKAKRSRLHILTVGRLAHIKGHIILLESLAELKRRNRAACATVIGEGPDRETLDRITKELQIASHVRFVGAIGQDAIRRWYAEADAFCLSSFGEGLPVVLMEAMAMELPVVATRIMGVAELVDDEVSGLLVPAGRPDRLADAISRLMDDPNLCRSMGRAARRKVVAEFNLKRSAQQLREVFREFLDESSVAASARLGRR